MTITKAQHTPGPWKFDYAGTASMLMTEKNKPLGFFYNPSIADTETRSNARLIAAAPELLEEHEANAAFLERLAAHLEENGMSGQAGNCVIRAKAARAAIAKAKGETV